ncbi:MAG TPA: UDP-N-acetylglucosamine 2-epimerase, partial [Chitinophagaceae bacterium]|nr:UDP-N-acetylglucosamine 2-epimerase [Chitinophagaceae bacterium]
TGTRADFGKLKSLIEALTMSGEFDVHIFATGMHLDERYGYTVHEIEKCGFKNIYKYANHHSEQLMDVTLAKTIEGFSAFTRQLKPDLIVVHGDRIEALAGASVGALNNILVAHIEGGELSGTVDELIRHAVSKLSQTHFVANEDAQQRLLQMGELEESIFIIGSPDMDVMLSETLPSLDEVKRYYEIVFDEYAVSLFHPVTTEHENMAAYADEYFSALEQSALNYVLIYPNNDMGSEFILNRVKQLSNDRRFKIFPSMRFEYFLTVLKHASFIAGNSSCGIREAPYYGVPTINVGSRQNRRTDNPDIIHANYNRVSVLQAIGKALNTTIEPSKLFGAGNSNSKFLHILQQTSFWKTSKQKIFGDVKFSTSQ